LISSQKLVSAALEEVSNKGCDYCREVLLNLQNAKLPPELKKLSKSELIVFQKELAAIMNVYDK